MQTRPRLCLTILISVERKPIRGLRQLLPETYCQQWGRKGEILPGVGLKVKPSSTCHFVEPAVAYGVIEGKDHPCMHVRAKFKLVLQATTLLHLQSDYQVATKGHSYPSLSQTTRRRQHTQAPIWWHTERIEHARSAWWQRYAHTQEGAPPVEGCAEVPLVAAVHGISSSSTTTKPARTIRRSNQTQQQQ